MVFTSPLGTNLSPGAAIRMVLQMPMEHVSLGPAGSSGSSGSWGVRLVSFSLEQWYWNVGLYIYIYINKQYIYIYIFIIYIYIYVYNIYIYIFTVYNIYIYIIFYIYMFSREDLQHPRENVYGMAQISESAILSLKNSHGALEPWQCAVPYLFLVTWMVPVINLVASGHIFRHILEHWFVHACTYIYMYVYIYICIYVYIYIYMYICICKYIYIYM